MVKGKRGKRPGLRARSKNAREGTRLEKRVRKAIERGALDDTPKLMYFCEVAHGVPREGALVLVRLRDNTYRFGMTLMGRFANYEANAGEFVTMAHPDRITHWMEIFPPVAFTKADYEAEAEFQAAGEQPEATPPSIMEEALAAGGIEDAAEDQYL